MHEAHELNRKATIQKDELVEKLHMMWRQDTKSAPCRTCPRKEHVKTCRIAGNFTNGEITFVLDRPPSEAHQTFAGFRQTEQAWMLAEACEKAAEVLGEEFRWNYLFLTGADHTSTLKGVMNSCSAYMDSRLDILHKLLPDDHTHTLVPMGKDATGYFFPKEKFSDIKSVPGVWASGNLRYQVVPTITIRTLFRSSGALDFLVGDIVTAIRAARESKEELPQDDPQELIKDYVFPQTDDELDDLAELIVNYTGKEGVDPDDWPIAVDSETTGLEAWHDGQYPFCISVAWDDGKSTTVFWEHDEITYSQEAAIAFAKKVLSCPKPKIFHNAKFDYQMLELKQGFKIENIWWDTLLSAHFLRPTAGAFALGKLMPVYAPRYAGYKQMIKKALRDQVIDRIQKNLNQSEPDVNKSYKLAAFYPEYVYEPVCERPDVQADWDKEDVDEIFELELEYIEAHIKGDKKAKSSARNRIRHRCKKHDIEYPDTISDRDFEKELNMEQGYKHVPFDVLKVYAAIDTDVTRQICKVMRKKAWEIGVTLHRSTSGAFDKRQVLDDLEENMRNEIIPLSEALGQAEYQGLRVDKKRLLSNKSELEERVNTTLKNMRNIVNLAELNPNSSSDMEHVVLNCLEIPTELVEYTDKSNQVSVTGGWVKKQIKNESHPEYVREFFQELRAYKTASKALDFMTQFEELSQRDGRIHTSFRQSGTRTARLSSADPNMQNVPLIMCKGDRPGHPGWNIKGVFVPDDRILWQLDIASAEIRVLAAYSRDADLIYAIKEGLDFHSYTAAECFPEYTYEEIKAKKDTDPKIGQLRSATKRVVFGLIYGAGPYTIAVQIFGDLTNDPAIKQERIQFAQDTMDKVKKRFPGIMEYTEETEDHVQRFGYTRTFLGRYRRFDLRDRSFRARARALRQAVNFRIQSASACLVNRQLVEIHRHIEELGGSIQLTVHDSIGGSAPRESLPKMREFFDRHIVESVKENHKWLPVPFAYDLEIGPTYGEKITFKSYERYVESGDLSEIGSPGSKQRRVAAAIGIISPEEVDLCP